MTTYGEWRALNHDWFCQCEKCKAAFGELGDADPLVIQHREKKQRIIEDAQK